MKTFAQMRLLEELREVLGDGLQSCLKVFPVLQDILDVTYLTEDMDWMLQYVKVSRMYLRTMYYETHPIPRNSSDFCMLTMYLSF